MHEPDTAAAARPSIQRHWVVAAATLMAVLLYLDRFCISLIERFMREDFGLSESQNSLVLSSFFWAYAIGQVPSGWLSDRYGARLTLTGYILFWSFFTAALGWAGGFFSLLLFRFGIGLGQAGAYPTSAGLISKWVPFRSRGAASGLVSTGGRIGGAIAPVLTGYLMVFLVPASTPLPFTADEILPAALAPPADTENTDDAEEDTNDADEESSGDLSESSLCALVHAWQLEEPGEPPKPARTFGRRILELQSPAQRAALQQSDVAAATLAAALNDALELPDLCQKELQDQVQLPAEARRILALPSAQRTPEQFRRLNRLALEAVYQDFVRKLYGRSWRTVAYIYGGLGLVVAWLFWRVVRDRPEKHPLVNQAELAAIAAGRQGAASGGGGAGKLPWGPILRNRSLWLISLTQFGTGFSWTFLVTLFPRYLTDAHRVPLVERGWMTSLPIFVGLFGMLAGGWLTDRLTQQLGLTWGRRLPILLTRFTAMSAFVACMLLDSPWAVAWALAVAAISTDLGTPAVWAYNQDVGGPYAGSILGWGNMWGNVAGALAPPVLNLVVGDAAQRWDAVFLVCAGGYLLSGLAALGVDAARPIDFSAADATTRRPRRRMSPSKPAELEQTG